MRDFPPIPSFQGTISRNLSLNLLYQYKIRRDFEVETIQARELWYLFRLIIYYAWLQRVRKTLSQFECWEDDS